MRGENERLMSEVQLGIETESFLVGPIGRYLMDKLRQDGHDALEELKRVNPRDIEKIISLQLTIARSEKIDEWLAGIIQGGWYAEQQLRDEEL